MSYKMAQGLVAAGEADLPTAKVVVRNQRACVLCGHGLLVLPWGAVVPAAERVILEALGSDGLRRSVPIHAGCLAGPSTGSAIAVALGFAEEEV